MYKKIGEIVVALSLRLKEYYPSLNFLFRPVKSFFFKKSPSRFQQNLFLLHRLDFLF